MTDLTDEIRACHDGPLTMAVGGDTDVPYLRVEGGLDMVTVPDFLATASQWLRRGSGLLVLDLRGVGFCGSSGLSALLDLADLAAKAGWELDLVPSRPVRRAMTILGMESRFRMVDGALIEA